MLDPIHLPILLKAIDFVFDEGRKILEERRERRKTAATSTTAEPTPDPQPAADVKPADSQETNQVKQELLTSRIDEILWRDHELEVQHLVRLLEKYSRSYYIAREQYATCGSALVPPIIVHNMTEAEDSMAKILKELEGVLSKVYKKDISPNQ